jgi:hypothetical protein
MPNPVPSGRFAEYAACLSEGFCPSCRLRFTHGAALYPGAGVTRGGCGVCGCFWEYNRWAVDSPQIRWRGVVDGTQWDIWVNDLDRQFGAAEWAELRAFLREPGGVPSASL